MDAEFFPAVSLRSLSIRLPPECPFVFRPYFKIAAFSYHSREFRCFKSKNEPVIRGRFPWILPRFAGKTAGQTVRDAAVLKKFYPKKYQWPFF
jgi:hypothetical protein